MDVVHLILDFVGHDRPLILEMRDGYLIQPAPNTSGRPRYIDYHTVPWLPPHYDPRVEWASIRLVQSAADPDSYHAMLYAKECRPDLLGGLHLTEPRRDLPGAFSLGRRTFVFHFAEEHNAWEYTGRGVTLRFPVESRLFFPHHGTKYEYTQAERLIYGEIVHDLDFTWKDRVKEYRSTIVEIERREKSLRKAAKRAATMSHRIASTLGNLFGLSL